jgi:hypothetical protein
MTELGRIDWHKLPVKDRVRYLACAKGISRPLMRLADALAEQPNLSWRAELKNLRPEQREQVISYLMVLRKRSATK